MAKRILFITHMSNRSGAPKALLYLLKWLKDNSNYSFDVCSLRGGELDSSFTKVANSYFVLNYTPPLLIRIFTKFGFSRISDWYFNFYHKRILQKGKYDLVYANTIASNKVIKFLPKDIPLITQVRELEYTFQGFGITSDSDIIKKTNHFIAINAYVKKLLIDKFNIESDTISIVGTYTKLENFEKVLNKDKTIFRVGASGTVEWRKGADLFIIMAAAFIRKYSEVQVEFVWVGKFPNSTEEHRINFEINKLNIGNQVRFIGEVDNPQIYYKTFNAFTLLSREEALGLVCIENMKLNIPVISFENCGGIQDYINKNAAIGVPYLDFDTLVDTLDKVRMNIINVDAIQQNAIQELENNFEIDTIGLQTMEILKKHIQV